ncbi:hypothetical protein GCM10027598_60410 [Amycolatopsis oliviviridis]|uniref:Uncharacterized protein n=1 Tax=Amycolatopsis oliviviridis TaxID=1471590 RepID=A0ABQ3MCY4_9PSEU|nr:hypothetical protein GCM10017790_83580 [Amycolatopsis oliviviridis]
MHDRVVGIQILARLAEGLHDEEAGPGGKVPPRIARDDGCVVEEVRVAGPEFCQNREMKTGPGPAESHDE